jgi:phosphatidylserine/phosphatidylglycerophosphate/cardiolipin synthase-like enzyme
MPLLQTHPTVDHYEMPADATPARSAVTALLTAATKKIRLAMYTLTDPTLITAIIAAANRGIPDIKIVLDWSQAHAHYESMAIAILRKTLGPSRVIYTTSPIKSAMMHLKACTIDDATLIAGSTNWTTEAWEEANELTVTTDGATAAAMSAAIDALAVYGSTHLPQA